MSRKGTGDEEGFHRFEAFLEEWSRRDFMKRTGGAAALAAFVAGVPEVLAACGNAQQTAPAETVRKGGKVVEASIADVQNFNSTLTRDTASADAVAMMYDGLYTIDPNADLFPLVAKEQPKISSDQLTYTIPLRNDVKWTDGKELTSDDVLFTYNLMFDPKYKKVNSPRRKDLEQFVESITAPDKSTIVFKLKKIYAPFATAQLGYGLLPKHLWGSLSPEEVNTTDFNTKPPATNGAFKFVEWKKDQQVTFARNENYYRGAPNLDNYIIKIIKSTEIFNQLKTGEVDWGSVDKAQADAAKAVDTIDLLTYPTLSFEFYAYQLDPTKSKLFQEKEVRQALLLALNRQQMADAIYFKYATVANTSMPPKSWAFNTNNKPVFPFDRKKAEDMLDAAGWTKGSDGTRAKGDLKLKFEMITNAANKVRENLLVTMQQQWKEIGVEATPKFVDFNKVLVPAITDTRKFDIFMVGFSWGIDPDQSALWHSRNTTPGGFNGAFYKSAELDKVLDDAVGTTDRTKRKDLYFKMQQILAEDQPAPILVFSNATVGVNKRVKNLKLGTFTQRRYIIKDIFVTDGK